MLAPGGSGQAVRLTAPSHRDLLAPATKTLAGYLLGRCAVPKNQELVATPTKALRTIRGGRLALARLFHEVRRGEIDPAIAAVLTRILSVLLASARDHEFDRRLAEVEASLATKPRPNGHAAHGSAPMSRTLDRRLGAAEGAAGIRRNPALDVRQAKALDDWFKAVTGKRIDQMSCAELDRLERAVSQPRGLGRAHG